MIVWRSFLRLVAWLCDVQPAGRCSPDGLGHYFGSGDYCECGEWPTSVTGPLSGYWTFELVERA